MNNEQIKSLLVSVADAPQDFTVVLSGKKSRKVNGLYHGDRREIILHNKNFTDDNQLIYTALHEYAHHLHCCKAGGRLSSRAHTTEFWAIFHELLEKAEQKQYYTSTFQQSPELQELTGLIRENCLKQNGALFVELGKLLLKAHALCEEAGLRFEDYIDRVLCMPRSAAKIAMKSFSYGLNPALGADNMRFISGIAGEPERAHAAAALLSGKSPDSVKMALRTAQREEAPRDRLEKERGRIMRTIESLSGRLKEVEAALDSLE